MQNFPGLSIVNQENVSVDRIFLGPKGGYLIYNCLLLPTLHIVDNLNTIALVLWANRHGDSLLNFDEAQKYMPNITVFRTCNSLI